MIELRKPFTFDRVSRIFFSIIFAIAIIYILILIKEALLPFLIAWLIAYLLNPLVGFFQNKLKFKNRILAIIATIIFAISIIIGASWLLAPSVTDEIYKLKLLINEYQNRKGPIPLIPAEWTIYFKHNISLDYLLSALTKEDIKQLIQQVAPRFWEFLSSSLNLVLSVLASVIILLYTIFILKDFDRISNGFIELFPVRYRNLVEQIISDVSYGMNRYFRGQALVSLIVGTLLAIGFKIIGMPLGIIMGLLMGLLNLIPYMKFVGLLPIVFLSLLKAAETNESFWVIIGLAFLVMAIVQGIEDMIIVPNVMGRVTGLNPAIILLSLSIWGSLLGLIGLIIALPATTLCLSYYKRYILHEIDKKNPSTYDADSMTNRDTQHKNPENL
ncbi:MAG: AI-2E family transporter [Bacteroidota bacterium]|nr:AI-2E family transporter [Bacteroidota bacterium]